MRKEGGAISQVIGRYTALLVSLANWARKSPVFCFLMAAARRAGRGLASLRRCLAAAAAAWPPLTRFFRPQAGSPKRSKAGAPSPPLSPEQLERIRRNKEAALQRLASRLGSLAPPEVAPDWRLALAGEFAKPYFAQLMDFVAAERKRYTVYPAVHQVFTWTQMCSIRDVKAVILGQDPYHGPNQAHGLCFSVQRPVPPPPRSTATQCCSYSPSTPSQLPQREGLGAVHRRSGLLAKQQLGWCGLHALGGLCSEERQLY
ncbi:uracil-DNA glycosylase isoform X4 [Podarcis muralis]